jgi:hypothetical protein
MFVIGSRGLVTGSSAFVTGSSAGGGEAGGGGDGAGGGLTGGVTGLKRATSTGREGCSVAELGVGMVGFELGGAAVLTPALAGVVAASAPDVGPVCTGSETARVGALGERLDRRAATVDVLSAVTGAAPFVRARTGSVRVAWPGRAEEGSTG